MPAKLDRCVSDLKAKWSKNPKDAPKRYKSGDKWKPVKGPDDLESAAFAICRASTGLSEQYEDRMDEMIEAILAEVNQSGGYGPLLKGVAAVNRPYIKFMNPLEVVLRDGKEWIKAQIVRFGIYKHPNGPDGKLPFTREFWRKVIDNFKNNVYGQKLFFDWAHNPNSSSLGEIKELEESGDGVNAWIDPTERGLAAVQNREVHYASIDLVFNHQSNQVAIAASELSELDEVDLADEIFVMFSEQQYSEEGDMSDKDKQTTPPAATVELPDDVVALQEQLKTMQADVDAQRKSIVEQRELLASEREQFATERAARLEEIRREKVSVFLRELDQPDENGMRLDDGVLKIVEKILLGDPIPTSDEYSIQLSEDAGSAGLRDAYYREAIEHLARHIPRVVPTGARLESGNQRPPSGSTQLSEERQAWYDAKLMAKKEAGVQITGELEAELKEEMKRYFGEEV